MNSDNDNLAISHNEEVAAQWCMRLFDGPLTEAETRDLDRWISACSGNGTLLERMVNVLHRTDAIADMPGFVALRAEALAAMDQPSVQKRSFGSPSKWAGIAAALGFIVLTVMSWNWNGANVYTTAVGERRSIHLADGSHVSLDADSQISVAFDGDRRTVVLDRGRAKFDVAKDPLRPFSVAAGSQAVVATGTSFSVELLKDQLRVLLYEGSVDVLPEKLLDRATAKAASYKATTSLDPGQELVATLTSGAGKIVEADMERSTSWQEGRLEFTNIPLSEAVERFNRYSKKTIVVDDPAAGRKMINGVFDAGDADSFVLGVTSLYKLSSIKSDEFINIRTSQHSEN